MTCPSDQDLTRAHQLQDGSLADHLAQCARCLESWQAVDRAIRLARELAVDVPPPAHREEIRTAVLVTAELARPATRRQIRIAWLGAAVAAAAVVIWLARPSDVTPNVSVRATAGTDYARVSSELVRLRDGTIDVDVEPLRAGQRFRVVVGDGEIEVRGTSFEVSARADHLVGVRVKRGRVEVRPVGAATTILDPGQTWSVQVAQLPAPLAPAPVTPVPVAPPLAPVAPPARAQAPAPRVTTAPPPRPAIAEPAKPPVHRSAEEVAYSDAWDAMRTGDFRTAATGFARVHALSPAGPLGDDAAFWHGVALGRDHRAADAIVAFRDMLDSYPSSPRTGEASAMLGWLLVDAHQLVEARRLFEAAADDRVPAVRASARKGLDALAAPPGR